VLLHYTWQNTETRKSHIFAQMLYYHHHEVYFRQNVHRNNKEERKEPTHTHALLFESSASHCLISDFCLWTCNSYSSCCRLPKSCNQLIQTWPVGAIVQEKWHSEFRAAAVELCCCIPCVGSCMSCVDERLTFLQHSCQKLPQSVDVRQSKPT